MAGDKISLNNILRTTSGSILSNVLKSINGVKDLILEPELPALLDQVSNLQALKSVGVEVLYELKAGPSLGETPRCVYLVRPTLESTRLIAEQITVDQQSGRNSTKPRQYFIIYIPRKLHICENLLEQEGVYERVTIKEFPLGLIALDTDVFSLQLPDFYPSFFLDSDYTWVHTVSSSLIQLQKLCGVIPNIYGQGRCAKMVCDVTKLMKSTMQLPNIPPLIGNLILIDRDVDYASVFLSQMTYEGLLDEVFGISGGKVKFEKNVTGSDNPVKLPLNSSDPVFLEIRDNHFSTVFNILKEKANHLKSKHDERQGMQIVDLKKFIQAELKDVQQQHKSLSLHIGACEVIIQQKAEEFEQLLRTEQSLLEGEDLRESINYIEESIIRQEPFFKSLRLLCLLSVTQDGISARDYRSLLTQFLHSYGHDHLVIIHALKKLGVLKEQPAISAVASNSKGAATANKLAGKFMAAVSYKKSSFTLLAKKLNLIPVHDDDYDYSIPPNSGYVFSGTYIPLACRLAEQSLQKEGGLSSIEEVLKQLPGTTLNNREYQRSAIGKKTLFVLVEVLKILLLTFVLFLFRKKSIKFFEWECSFQNHYCLFFGWGYLC